MLRFYRGAMYALRLPLPKTLAFAFALLIVSEGAVDCLFGQTTGRGGAASPKDAEIVIDDNASTEELLESAREMFIADRYELAEMLYKSILVREPENLSAMLELAVIYEATGQLQYARGLLTRALVIRPHDDEIIERNAAIARTLAKALESEVDSLLARGAYETALPKLSVLLAAQPENSELHYRKAICHLKLGRPAAALAEIDQALNLRREQHYHEFKQEVLALTQGSEISSLTVQAKRALQGGRPEDEERALVLIGRILELDADHAWARERFLALTEAEQRSGQPGSAGRTSVAGWWTATKRAAGKIAEKARLLFLLLSRHAVLLFSVLIIVLIFSSPLTRVLVRGFSPRQSLTGRLDHFSIEEVLTMINTHHRTGALSIAAPSARGKIYFDKGEVYHCTCRGAIGHGALQRLLKEAKEGFFVFKDGHTARHSTIDTPLSLILMELPERVASTTSEGILKKQQSKMRSLLGK